MSGPALAFQYRNARGEEACCTLMNWRESGRYLSGRTERGFRTFRKDRVLRYLDGAEGLLQEPFSPEPPKPARQARKDSGPQILFTGFAQSERNRLEGLAGEHGMQVVKSVTQGLDYLCGGPNAGPAKLEKARERGTWILTSPALMALLDTGELPDEEGVFE